MNKLLILVIIFSSFAWVQLLRPAEHYDSDERLAPLFRLVELDSCLREGTFPVRWAPDTYGGRGSPYFNFYAPLFYYLAEIPHLLGFGVLWSVKITIAFVFITAGASMFLLVKHLAGERAGFLSAVLFVYSPYLLFDVYIRGSLGEALGFSLLPLILLALHMRSPILAGAVYAALILSHNALALLFTPFLILYAACLCIKRELRFTEASLALVMGLGLSAFFWAPAIREMNSVEMNWILMYDYKGAFIGLTDVVSPMGHLIRSTVERRSSLQLGAVHLVFALLAYPFVKNQYTRIVLALLALSIFLMTPYSSQLWSFLPLGRYVQFPWRLFAISALFSSILAGMSLGVLSARLSNKWLAGIALILVISSVNFIGYSNKISVDNEAISTSVLRGYYDSGLTYGHEYLPYGASVPTSSVEMKVEPRRGNVKILEVREGCSSLEFKSIGSGEAKVNTNWFPGWTARVNGLPSPLYPNSDGSMFIPLVEDLNIVSVRFENTRIRTISNSISLVSIIVLFFLSRERRKRIERQEYLAVSKQSIVESDEGSDGEYEKP